MTRVSYTTLLLGAALMSAAAFGQGSAPQTSGIDITGSWFTAGAGTDGGANILLVDYGGAPLSEAGRLYGLAWSPSRMTLRQQQCAQYDPTRLLHGGGNRRFWEDRDPYTQKLIAIKMYGQITEGTRTVWMDGRPHPPPYAKHRSGVFHGKYEGPVLTVYTTHLKRNWIRTKGFHSVMRRRWWSILSARRSSHVYDGADRSGLLDRALDPDYGDASQQQKPGCLVVRV